MAFIEAPTNFYMGRIFSPQTGKMTDDIVYYDSRDLTTHAIIVGMTGSGKTGLGITMLEEAILDQIPAIVIDPKGDITNIALNFPNMQPSDFAQWIHADQAQRAGMSQQQYAADVAQEWRDGLASWGIVPDRLRWMRGASKVSIYTPGSDAGLPISIVASLRAPRVDWNVQAEEVRERVNGIVTAIFALAGMNFEPVKDAEHVLVSNIFEWNWRQGRDLTLHDVILQIKEPPFEKLGVFSVNDYISEKNRYKLAMELNNIIAAPSFQSWMVGEPLDIQRLLYRPNGQPQVSVFYTAHLNDQERMFITTLLLESLIGWMRTQSGTSSLRAMLYIDEMYGYFPPYPKNPPTKKPIMSLLKQARAFGVGLVLATQNPGDLDYKGLTNAGTWFIGRLSTENDKRRVIDGLRSMATTDNEMELNDVEQLISDIRPRVFLMRNVHNTGGPILLHTRWAMSYLAGPLTRQQISILMQEERARLMQRLAGQQQASQYQQHQQSPLQQNYWQQAQQSYYNAPPPPPGFSPSPAYGGQPMGAPPPPPGMPNQGGYGQFNNPNAGFGTQAAPPPPPNPWGNQPPMPNNNPMGGFGAQSATGGMPPVNPGDTGPTASMDNGGNNISQSKPPVKSEIREYFLPVTMTAQQAVAAFADKTGQRMNPPSSMNVIYKPVLFAQASVRYQQKSAQIYTARQYAFHIENLRQSGLVHWEEWQAPVVDSREVTSQPAQQALFDNLPIALNDPKRLSALEKEVIDFLYNTARLVIPFHSDFKIYGDPDRDMSEFQSRVTQIAREKRDDEVDKLTSKYAGLMDKLEDKLVRKQRELEAEQVEIKDRKREQLYTTGEAILSIFQGRTNYTLSRMSRTQRYRRQTEADLQESREVIGSIEREIIELEEEYEQKLREVNDKWAKIATTVDEHTLTPYKKDIAVDMYGVGWIPHYYVATGGVPIFVPAFG